MSLRKISTVFLFCVLSVPSLSLAGFAQQTAKLPEGITKGPSLGGVTEYNLKNGLKVLLIPDRSRPNIIVNVVYHVGSRHEGYGETGMAHLLEHLVFKGTPKYGNITGELTKRGMAPNGTTSFDRTNYFATFPPTGDNLEFYLDMEADRMINSFIAKKDLDSEFSVVRNEMESGENNPQRILLSKLMATAYQWHNYGKSTIGARSDVENVRIENLQAFYRKYYQPDNATLIIGGNFETERTLELINEKFGVIPRPSRRLEPTWTVDPPQDGERQVIVRRVGGEQLVIVGYHIPPAADPDSAALLLLDRVLVDNPTGKLYKALIDTKKAVSLISGNFQQKEPGITLYGARLNMQQSVDEVAKTLIETVENVAAQPPTREEIERLRATYERQMDTITNEATNVAQMMTEWVARGDWRLYFLHREQVRNVTPEDVQRVAKSYLLPSNRTLGKFIPSDNPVRASIKRYTDEEIATITQGAKADETLADGEVFEATPENIEARVKRSKIGNIITAFLPKETRGDVVTLRLSLRFGDAKSLKGLQQTGSFTASLLNSGTLKRTRQQIREESDRLKSSIVANGDADGVEIGITSTRQNLAEALKIAAEILKEPAFPESEFEKAKIARIAALEAQRSEPSAIANREMRRAFSKYEKGDLRYAPTLDEEIADIKAVTLDQIKAFYKGFYGASNAELVIVGDFDEEKITPVVDQLFASWRSPKPYTRIPQEFFDVPAAKKIFETPDKANAVFLARQSVRMSDAHPDYPALAIGNYIFGGGFLNSRLATRLRQKDGLSYSVGSGFSAGSQDENASIFAQAIYAPENAEKLENAFYEELGRVLTDGFTGDELKEAKQGWLLSRERNRGTDAFLRNVLGNYIVLNRTFAWDAELESKVQALTLEEVNAAFRKHIVPAKISIFKAGDFSKSRGK
ncbi:MAG TPA: pitrilysin family protein [Pyrinomonadaceae bacterium]|nr:pitrilysin family protein [Pyrinomonadaceae bacterium]